ncbi:MAG: hypothetical protein HRT61_22765, partial [Ekhidna sp.]|nr:hypothetical protein [Ekhidna sp.]
SFSFTDQPDITVEASTGDGRFLIRSSENKEETFEDINLMDKLFKGLGDFQ